MDGERGFRLGEIVLLTYGRFEGREVEIVDELATRVIMVIRGYQVERETYRVLMPTGKIESVAPQYLRKRGWRSANADALETERQN
jgi:ribosomal protein L14E/L6E/L27E